MSKDKDITEQRIECPHCGHHLFLSLDISGGDQDYYDECPLAVVIFI